MVHLTHNSRFCMVLKMLDKMASLWFVMDFNGSFGLALVFQIVLTNLY